MKTDFALSAHSEILILPDGNILAHNITREMAVVLCELDPENEPMRQRACSVTKTVENRHADRIVK